METGTLIKSTNFHTHPYWVVKCDKPNLKGNRFGELPIDAPSLNFHPWKLSEGLNIKFELVEIGNVENYKHYARLLY